MGTKAGGGSSVLLKNLNFIVKANGSYCRLVYKQVIPIGFAMQRNPSSGLCLMDWRDQ